MNLTTSFFEHHVRYLDQLLDSVGGLSPEALDAPIRVSVPSIDDEPTIRSLLSRLIGQMEMWSESMAGAATTSSSNVTSQWTPCAPGSRAWARPSRRLIRDLGAATPDDETFVDTTCEPRSPYAAGMLGHILTYGSYRRTLVTAAVEAATGAGLGVRPPGVGCRDGAVDVALSRVSAVVYADGGASAAASPCQRPWSKMTPTGWWSACGWSIANNEWNRRRASAVDALGATSSPSLGSSSGSSCRVEDSDT